jgi:glycosyltransferase involved in cell wall biosynthesis
MNLLMKPRVLIVADHFGYAGGVIHGVTSYYLNVLPRVRLRGVELRCCFLREPHPVADRLRESGVPVDFLAARKWDPFVVGRIERIARAMDANVLHVIGMKAAVIGRLVARRTGAGLIIHSHDMNLPPLPVSLLYRMLKLDREIGLAVSAAAASYMAKAYAIKRRDVTVLPNGVDVSGIHRTIRADRPAGLPASSTLIAWIGRLHEVKGPQRMIRAMAALARRFDDVALVMIGDGPERASCASLIRHLGLTDRVYLLGQRNDVEELLKHMRLLCITSQNEGFSLVAAEAAAASVPVVGYSVGGLPEVIVDGVTGTLVPDGDEASFVEAVARLVRDDALHAAFAQASLAHAEKFSMGHHVDALIAEYQRACGRDAGASP